MKETLGSLAAYNIWANQLLMQTILPLPKDVQEKALPSSFGSLLQTVVHMWNAESIWWQRLKLSEHVLPPANHFSGGMKEAAASLLQQNRQWQQWVEAASEPMFQHEFIYQNTKGQSFKNRVGDMLLHVFNHGTYHRGQLVNLLRQCGIEKIPQTDFIVWQRK